MKPCPPGRLCWFNEGAFWVHVWLVKVQQRCLENQQVLQNHSPLSGNHAKLGRDEAPGACDHEPRCSSASAARFRPARKLVPYLHSIMLEILGQQLHVFFYLWTSAPCPVQALGSPRVICFIWANSGFHYEPSSTLLKPWKRHTKSIWMFLTAVSRTRELR